MQKKCNILIDIIFKYTLKLNAITNIEQNVEGNTEGTLTIQGGDSQCMQRQPRVKSRNGIDYVTRNVQSASNAPKTSPKVEHVDYLKKENFGKVPA